LVQIPFLTMNRSGGSGGGGGIKHTIKVRLVACERWLKV